MNWMRTIVSPVLPLALLVVVGTEGEAYGQKQKKKGPPPAKRTANVPENDSRLKTIRRDLEAVFRHWDADKDNKVTADELARGLRGKDAKPYRAPSPGEAGKSGTRELKLPEITKKYPDYAFLLRWDKDRDDVLSVKEFDEFVGEVAAHYKTVFRKQDELEQLQKQLAVKDINASRKARIQAQMKILNTQLGAARDGFQHQLSLDYIAQRQALRRADWLWYKTAPVPRKK